MRADAKASLTNRGNSGGIRVGGLLAIAALCLLALVPRAQAADGVYDFWGNPSSASSALAGEFAVDSISTEGKVGPMGLAVSDATGDVYVTDPGNNRIQQFSEDGEFIRAWGIDVSSATASEMQGLMVNATGGKFTLSFGAETTGELDFNAPASGGAGATGSVENALAALPGIGAGNVRVYGGPGSAGGAAPYVVRFTGSLAGSDVAQITGASAAGTPLTGGVGTGADAVTTATHAPGGAVTSSFEICEAAAQCGAATNDAAAGGMSSPKGIAINQSSGDVYVVDEGHRRIDQFTADGVWLRSWGQDVITSGPHESGTTFEICTAVDVCKTGDETGTTGGAFRSDILLGVFNTQPAVVPAGLPDAGNVLVADPANARVQEFSPAGAFVRAFGFDVEVGGSTTFEVCTVAANCKEGTLGSSEPGQFSDRNPQRVAVDSTGAIYAVDAPSEIASSGPLRVQKFTPQAGPPALSPSVFAPGVLTGSSAETGPTGITVDPTDNHVFVAKSFKQGEGSPPASGGESRILELDSTGALLDTHIAGAGLNPPIANRYPRSGYAVAAGGPLYMTATAGAGAPRVFRIEEVTPPTVTLSAISDVTADSVVVHGVVNPNGGGLDTSYRVEYSLDGRKWIAATSDVSVGNGTTDVTIEPIVGGLPSNAEFQIRLLAIKPFNSALAISPPLTVRTQGAPPLAETGSAWWNGSAELRLTGTVNPRNSSTNYYFEYGPTESYGQSVPVNRKGVAGDGGVEVQVAQQLYDLDTNTAFHYRIVAVNASGTTEGEDRVIAPHSQSYVYELVSAGESNGLGILGVTAVDDDGERVTIESQTLGDPPSLPSQTNAFVSQRGADGWTIPSFGPDPGDGSGTTIALRKVFSADLGSMIFPQRTTIEAMAQEGRWTLSRIDGTAEPASPHLVPLERLGNLSDNQGAQFQFEGGDADLSTFVFKKALDLGTVTYLPGEPLVPRGYAGALQVNIYQSTRDGSGTTLSLVNRDSSDIPISNVCGAWVGPSAGLGQRSRPVSSDGSVVYFSARPGAPTSGTCSTATFKLRIFKRVDDSDTVEVSQSQCTRTVPTPCSSANGDDVYQGASSDGEAVAFTSTRQLTDSDQDAIKDLYLYDADPPAGQPTLVHASAGEATAGHPQVGSGADVQGVTTVSADGSRVYFVAKGQLTAEATQGARNLFVFERSDEHPGGRIEFIASLSAFGDLGLWSEGTSRNAWTVPLNDRSGENAGDGHVLFFVSLMPLLAADGDIAADLYRYDDDAAEVTCISCAGDGAFGVTLTQPALNTPSYMQESRIASADGTAAVFTTAESILPEDANSVADVYAWRDGALQLVSGATGATGSGPIGMISADGGRVFLTTKAALHPSDQNSGLDVYAASIGGGLPLPRLSESGCEDDQSCRGDAPPSPPVGVPTTPTFNGSGNVTPAKKRCKKPKVKRKGRCVKPKKARGHQKRKHQKSNRTIGEDRGGRR